jgi:hypothetical protein
MSTRDRLEARADRRDNWATKATAASDAALAAAHRATDMIPFGQPILCGHHSEGMHRAAIRRSDSAMSKAVERGQMAVHHEQCADGIRKALDRSIFTDDDNAIDALRERIAGREAECERIKAYNQSCRQRKAAGDMSLLDEAQRKNLVQIARVCAYQLGKYGEYPAYALTNLRGCISNDKKRLAAIVEAML